MNHKELNNEVLELKRGYREIREAIESMQKVIDKVVKDLDRPKFMNEIEVK